jgi:putative tricarboxylic transport membrane protein
MKAKSRRDVASGSVLFLVALLYFIGTWGLPAGKDEPGPAFFPVLLSCALMLLALSILRQGMKAETEDAPSHTPWKPILAVAVTALFVALFQVLGFVLSTLAYTLSITLMFRRDRILTLVVVPIVSTVFLFLLFRIGLGVRLPEGLVPWL